MSETSDHAPEPGTLACRLAHDLKGIRHECTAMRELATHVGHLHPAVAPRMTEMMMHLITLASYVTGIETSVSAKKAAGELEPGPRQTAYGDMELFASTPPPQLVIVRPPPRKVDPFPAHEVVAPGPDYWRSLRRTGDDTRSEANDHNVMVEGKTGTGVERA